MSLDEYEMLCYGMVEDTPKDVRKQCFGLRIKIIIERAEKSQLKKLRNTFFLCLIYLYNQCNINAYKRYPL